MRALNSFLLSLTLAVTAWAQRADPSFDPVKDVSLRFEKGSVVVGVPSGAHLKAAFMEVVKKEGSGTLKMGKLPPTTAKDEIGDGIWHGQVKVPVSGEGLSGAVKLQVTYQPCTEGEGGVCYPPTTRTLEVKAADIPGPKAAVLPAGNTPEAAKAEAQPAPVSATVSGVPPSPAPGTPTPASPSHPGLIWSLLLVFLAGMGASLTPCVYPMIPITMAIVGAKGGGKARGFALSAVLVLGMAVTYTTLGVLAAKSGAAFGAFAQKPAFLIPVSLLFAAFALSLFGAFEIALPPSLAMKLQGDGSRKGFGGAFLMGLVLGPLSAPCVGPVIGAVLVGIAQQGIVWLGGLQLFVFSLGMGVLFLAVGTFSAGLPKSGEWLTRFKQIMGLIVLGFAAWNVRLIVPAWANDAMWTFVMLAGSAVFGLFEAADDMVGQFRKALAILMLVLGALLSVRMVESFLSVELLPRGGAAAAAKEEHGGWMEQDLEGALAKAKAEHKVVLVDIYAEWCAQCKELDEKTWPEAGVKQWLAQNAVAIRIDTDAKRKDLAAKLQIRSYPTVILLDGEGRELRRSLGFQKPETMKAFLQGNAEAAR
ncbi:cytochrome c biogenesis protein CcdA [Geothrix sp. PMB-07]|uniref:cytochrome c biogenesis protein CcdA n=1 Tax=Geothrix sp. PMB-07 TaxID=3068640 RepID=UPI002740D11A|nr:cytochrome c biogenesis protein CcdA [Geothrix sp. PMB-07]WLT31996.1 cytochrome c biogenesis protein CcdA [Geothrix sp. PMB-07]